MHTLSVKECLRFGWKTFRSRPWFFVGATAIIFAVSMVSGELDSFAHKPDAAFFGLIVGLVAAIISVLLYMGEVSFALRAHDAPSAVSLRDLWAPRPFWKAVGTVIIVMVGTVIGLILLIVPGVIFIVLTAFALPLVMDKGLGPIEAIKRSIALTKGNRWNLFLLMLACLGISILGFLALFVGLLVSTPVTLFAVIHAYRTLEGSALPVVVAEAPEAVEATREASDEEVIKP
jgi:uncharacterized membrane protein